MAAEETEELSALCHRLKMFVDLPTAEVNAMVDRVLDRLRRDFDGTLTIAIQSLKEDDMRQSAYVHALEIIAADREVDETRDIIFRGSQDKSKIDPAFIEKAGEVIGIKNKF